MGVLGSWFSGVKDEKGLSRYQLLVTIGYVGQRTFVEHVEQTQRPQSRQWCLRLRQPKVRPHRIQLSVLLSGIHIAGTKCSTFPLVGLLSFSSGRYGNACKACRK